MIDPAKPFSSKPRAAGASASASLSRSQVSAAKSDLSGLLERARDERFRMLKMLREARDQVAQTTEPPTPEPVQVNPAPATPEPDSAPAVSTERLQKLIDKLSALDAGIDAKLSRLGQISDEKLSRLEKIDQSLSPKAQQLGHALADGKMIQSRLEAAAQKNQGLAAQVTEQLERFDDHLFAYQEAGANAFGEEIERMKQAALGEMQAEVGQRRLGFDNEMAQAQALLERELAAKFDALADALHEKAEGLVTRTENTADDALKRVRSQVVQAMARTHDTQEAFRGKLEEHRQNHRDYLASLADSADGEFQVHAQRLDETMTGLTELFDHQADQILNQLRDRATALLDQMADTVLKLQRPEGEAEDEGGGDDVNRQAA